MSMLPADLDRLAAQDADMRARFVNAAAEASIAAFDEWCELAYTLTDEARVGRLRVLEGPRRLPVVVCMTDLGMAWERRWREDLDRRDGADMRFGGPTAA